MASVTCSWTVPADGGSPILSYTLQRQVGSGAFETIAGPAAGATSYVDGTAADGTAYGYRVAAVTALGVGAWSTVKAITTSGGSSVPSVPLSVATTQTAGTATLTWQAPASAGSSAITGYRVSRDGVDSSGYGAYSAVVPAGDRSVTFNALVAGATYNLRVLAINATGDGPAEVRTVTMSNAVGGAAPAQPTVAAGQQMPTETWVTDFIDDFDDYTVTTQKWNLNRDAYTTTSGSWTEGGAVMQVPPATANLEVRDGTVFLRTKRVTGLARPFTAAMMTTSRTTQSDAAVPKWATQEGGTYFVEARLWCGRAKGTWNALWLLGDTYSGLSKDVYGNPTVNTTYVQHWDGQTATSKSAGWPTGGEIDMLEFADNAVGDMDKPWTSLHWARDHNENATPPYPGSWLYREHMGHPSSAPARPELRNSWHTWGMYRSPYLIIHFIDGVEISRWHRYDGGTATAPATSGARKVYTAWDGSHVPASVEWTKPMFLFLNNAVGVPGDNNSWSGQGYTSYDQFEEGELRAAYVKVWKKP